MLGCCCGLSNDGFTNINQSRNLEYVSRMPENPRENPMFIGDSEKLDGFPGNCRDQLVEHGHGIHSDGSLTIQIPSGDVSSLLLNMAIERVDLSMRNGDFPWLFVGLLRVLSKKPKRTEENETIELRRTAGCFLRLFASIFRRQYSWAARRE